MTAKINGRKRVGLLLLLAGLWLGVQLPAQDPGVPSLWGSNLSGQLAAGVPIQNLSPEPIPSSDSLVGVSCGAHHTHALTGGGSLYGWGRNGNGQLGDGSDRNRAAPVEIPTLDGQVKFGVPREEFLDRVHAHIRERQIELDIF